ncbi:autotransporter domain-containing protein [Glycocaulis abyssi]|uniref:Autotransporter domain-containing protein n=1 Tax=Glycocaulis abyssi TaxID=1433403 RepID=A0ABV9NGR1_9PROT
MIQTIKSSLAASTALASILTVLAMAPAMSQELETYHDDEAFETYANAVSADGLVVVGRSRASTIDGYRAFRWTGDGGFEQLADAASAANALSSDGTVIVGSVSQDDTNHAFRWTTDGGLQVLDLPDGGVSALAYGVSADGSVIVGSSTGENNSATAVRWNADGQAFSLGTLEGGNRSTAFGVSGDGLVIVGESSSGTSGPWAEAFRWTEATGMVELGKLNNSDQSQARAASFDGSVIVGWARDGETQQQTAIRWTEETGMESLGMLNDGNLSIAYDVSDDGLVIVGSAANGDENNVFRAFRWTEDTGMQTVEDWLRDAGADIESDITWNARGVNGDGTVVVGDTHDNEMFIARVSQSGVGMITLDDLAQSLSGTGASNAMSAGGLGLAMNGAGSRPLDRRAEPGRSTAWIGGDWGRDSHGARDGDARLGEIGFGHNFGSLQLNGVLGITALEQNTLLGGRSDVDAHYVKLEVLAPLQVTDNGGLWLAVTGTGLWGEADIRRNYIANGGLVDTSTGSTDVEGYGVRTRLQWENALPGVSPYGELSYARVCLDAYSETGGSFPAAFNRLCDTATEARYGVDATLPVTEGLRLVGTLEGVRRFEGSGSNVTGQVIGLGGFDLGQAAYQRDWLRAGAGFELDIAGSTLSVMANGTTRGESASSWVAASWRVAF